ncbi:50S ribosomal protein L24 [candidate division WWE3 bacterium RIFCSPLOWO2_01_FULL_39_13]|uniref:Large ribosomal subunit protein uL24 n=1 Tax=candidate division WWE3 bacterium RIFCSPLOWO2_01_FULL_39_13 TaxID=1802624 RepID=A0A1F4V4Z0_UNCKA|nr:MAG: 50S ribosomal protein L24 [candidate division WWE3 bacterium RIFCSPLOWO2_01_FULL_39_13]
MKIQKGDKVKILSGKYKGKDSVIEKVLPKLHRVVAENVNMVSKHVKPSSKTKGGIVKLPKSIHVSTVMLICPKCSKPVRIGYRVIDGKKYRVCRSCKEVIKK